MSQTMKKMLEEKNVSELSAEIDELKNRVKRLEENLASMKLKMGKKWV
jgi:polyhydroxyalkanoate synthesis regulator phasin